MSKMDDKAQKAQDYFNGGFSCAQSVFATFYEEMGLSEAKALQIASCMGGGVGGLREICGAFTGMTMALGAIKGYGYPVQKEIKERLYAMIQQNAARFKAEHGTLICRELLEKHEIPAPPLPADRTVDYYRFRPCGRYVAECARYVEEELEK
jgi:C_GCAxxG_C_C family probable redox protein